MQPQHRWSANDIINISIVVGLLVIVFAIIVIYGVMYFLGKVGPDFVLVTIVTSVTSGLIGYLARDPKISAQQPSPQVNMGDGSTTNVTPAPDATAKLPDPSTLPNSGGPNGKAN